MKFSFIAAAATVLIAPAAAQAAVTFNGVCASTATTTRAKCSTDANGNTVLSGTPGNSATIYASGDLTLGLKITAWQANQSNNAITSAFLGAYGGGFGVTGTGDTGVVNGKTVAGEGGTHQIDNAGGYTDFVMLQFSRAVKLEGLDLNLYSPYTDSDASIWNATALTPAGLWNSTIDLTNKSLSAGLWSTTPGGSTSGYRSLVTSGGGGANGGFSQVWLVSASVAAAYNDGFKLEQLMVTPQVPAVPEPATWAMMIAGFGAIGATLRRRRAVGVPQSA